MHHATLGVQPVHSIQQVPDQRFDQGFWKLTILVQVLEESNIVAMCFCSDAVVLAGRASDREYVARESDVAEPGMIEQFGLFAESAQHVDLVGDGRARRLIVHADLDGHILISPAVTSAVSFGVVLRVLSLRVKYLWSRASHTVEYAP